MNARARPSARGGPRRGRHLALLAALGLMAMFPPAAGASSDRSTTHAYLQALHALDLATLAGLASSGSAVTALQARIGSECPGALAGLPAQAKRTSAQSLGLEDIAVEAEGAVAGAWASPDAQAFTAFGATLRRLHWTRPAVDAKERYELGAFQLRFGLATPDLCADARAWQASGYSALSPASTAYAKAHRARVATLMRLALKVERLAPHTPLVSTDLDIVLARSARPRDRALERENASMNRRLEAAVQSLGASAGGLLSVLGAPS